MLLLFIVNKCQKFQRKFWKVNKNINDIIKMQVQAQLRAWPGFGVEPRY